MTNTFICNYFERSIIMSFRYIRMFDKAINNNKNSNIVLKSDFLNYIEKLLKDYCSK